MVSAACNCPTQRDELHTSWYRMAVCMPWKSQSPTSRAKTMASSRSLPDTRSMMGSKLVCRMVRAVSRASPSSGRPLRPCRSCQELPAPTSTSPASRAACRPALMLVHASEQNHSPAAMISTLSCVWLDERGPHGGPHGRPASILVHACEQNHSPAAMISTLS